MKANHKDGEKLFWDQMTSATPGHRSPVTGRPLPKLMVWLLLFISLTYMVYTLKLLSYSRPCPETHITLRQKGSTTLHQKGSASTISNISLTNIPIIPNRERIVSSSTTTGLQHIVFGIAASSRLWEKRKNYIKLWWRPKQMRGIVWLDKKVKSSQNEGLPPIKISGNTSRFSYTNRQGRRSAIRISRIVSETLRLGLKDVKWFVMGDDDTVFVVENLVRVLSKYDHKEFYYIGSHSESHLQNIYFSYGMAYGGGGFAISYPLAVALEKIQDRCIQRYPGLYGSDDRIQACMAELGVPLSKELGFHQYDVYGNLFGLLAAHPVTPLVSLHHLDVVEPIFPNMNRVEALGRLFEPILLDSAGIMQQSICYHRAKKWTISVSWGFAIQIFRGVISAREIQIPSRTFLNWYRKADYTAYAFNTRPVSRNPCQKPFVFYLSRARYDPTRNITVTVYSRHRIPHPQCRWKMEDASAIDTIEVYKKLDLSLWDKSPRRNCCRLMPSEKRGEMIIDVGVCREGEISEI
ncbi:uncharacterized protein LOC143880103 [Tasmannia lanceolata]|uniref:uncharacterized protein LOC143880103 n=1 Tax=Tasmannia lanceolata TaxID=3420 RepID=UPI004063A21E